MMSFCEHHASQLPSALQHSPSVLHDWLTVAHVQMRRATQVIVMNQVVTVWWSMGTMHGDLATGLHIVLSC